ncbi:hypothetical protein KKF55_00810 [Patescibacteria group bacterium]|nr:hypothetical protein [Patescibacteria group bacterium]
MIDFARTTNDVPSEEPELYIDHSGGLDNPDGFSEARQDISELQTTIAEIRSLGNNEMADRLTSSSEADPSKIPELLKDARIALEETISSLE